MVDYAQSAPNVNNIDQSANNSSANLEMSINPNYLQGKLFYPTQNQRAWAAHMPRMQTHRDERSETWQCGRCPQPSQVTEWSNLEMTRSPPFGSKDLFCLYTQVWRDSTALREHIVSEEDACAGGLTIFGLQNWWIVHTLENIDQSWQQLLWTLRSQTHWLRRTDWMVQFLATREKLEWTGS